MKRASAILLFAALVVASCASNSVIVHDPLAKKTEEEYREIASRHAAYGNSRSSREWNDRADEQLKKSDASGGWISRLFDTIFFGVLNASLNK